MAIDPDVPMIAPGADNVAGLLTLDQLSPPLFYRSRGFRFLTEFYEQEGQHNDSLGLPQDYGLIHFVWALTVVQRDEYQYLRTLRGRVTVYEFAKTMDAMVNYNATLIIKPPTPDQWHMDCWRDVRLDFWYSTVIP